jgi:hypothetical protein
MQQLAKQRKDAAQLARQEEQERQDDQDVGVSEKVRALPRDCRPPPRQNTRADCSSHNNANLSTSGCANQDVLQVPVPFEPRRQVWLQPAPRYR